MLFKDVCNICLAFDAPMRVINKSALQNVYEKLTNISLNTADRPVIACYLCYSQLRKSHNLMVRSVKADRVLTQIQQSGQMVKEELMTRLNFESRQLSNALVVTSCEIMSIAGTAHSTVKVEVDPLSLEYKERTERDSLTSIENIKYEKLEDEDIERDLLEDGGIDNEEFTDGGNIKKEEIDIDSFEIEDVAVGKKCNTEDGTVLALREVRKSARQNSRGKKKSRSRKMSRRKERNASTIKGIDEVTRVDCNNDCTDTNTDVDNTASKDSGGLFNIANDDMVVDLFLLTEHDDAGKVKRDLTSVDENLQEKILLRKSSNKRGKYKCKKKIKWDHFECDMCQKKVKRKSSLILHFRTHTGEKPFICEICAKRFVDRQHLNIHLIRHTGEKRFECNTCHAKFKHKDALRSHLRRHTSKKGFKCNMCQRLLYSKAYLTQHLRTHTMEKPIKCTICQKGFNNKSSLSVHIRTHTLENLFKCDICQKTFIYITSYNRHVRTHADVRLFPCEHCQRKFTTKDHLKLHLRSHTGERPYECDVCQVKFTRKETLKSHLRRHTGEKPFECVICKRRFNQRSCMNTHLRIHSR